MGRRINTNNYLGSTHEKKTVQIATVRDGIRRGLCDRRSGRRKDIVNFNLQTTGDFVNSNNIKSVIS